MKRTNLNLVKYLILLCWAIGCHAPEKNGNTQEEIDFQSMDVYQNPNTFKGITQLEIGITPPPLKMEEWFNGSGLLGFERGQVYVVEFFASWCGPCRKSIPHLSKLQQEFMDKLTVLGVAASENEPNSEKLKKMISAKKLSLNYLVGYTNNQETFKQWMWGAKNTGLPWAFIIDRKGENCLVWSTF